MERKDEKKREGCGEERGGARMGLGVNGYFITRVYYVANLE